jgi:diguanylate cyclase (GGDEF)-like protein
MYRQSIPVAIEALNAALTSFESQKKEGVESLRRIAHQLRGSGASYGFEAVSRAAEELELASEEEIREKVQQLVNVLRDVENPDENAASLRVLLAADTPSSSDLKEAMIDAGMVVNHAATAEQVEEELLSFNAEIVVIDLVLPDRDGRNLLMQLRRRKSTEATPVIILGPPGSSSVQSECMLLGANDYVEKPVDPEQLIYSISLVMGASQTQLARSSDALTGLPSARELRVSYRQLLALMRRNSTMHLSFCLLDLDNLTKINSTYGHSKGDEVIKHAAEFLTGRIRESDTLARWESDRFVILMTDTKEQQAAESLNGVLSTMRESISIPGLDDVQVTFSAGVAQVESDMDFDEALLLAESRAFQAKSSGRAQVICSIAERASEVPRILVADDDEMILRLITHRLEREGFEVTLAKDGKQAIELANQPVTYSLVILDVKMPMRDGFDVLRELRAMSKFDSIPIVMLTSMGNERDVIRGFDLGATDYLTKPFSPRELTARILHQLKRRV